jgi:hypothetical protein
MIISKWKGIGRNYGSWLFLLKLSYFYGVYCEDTFLFEAALCRRVFKAIINALIVTALKKMNGTVSFDVLARRKCGKKLRIEIT